MTIRVRQQLLASTLLLGMAAYGAPAFAQAETEAPAAEANEEIVVTGSRIARPDLDSPVPVAVVGAADLQRDAAVNIQDTLSELPQVGIGSSRTNTNFLTAGNGVATVNLRNLGDSRTLVLVNGRRFVAGLAGSSAVDINNIPTDFIERVEVVTGGASAIYGSEAIAGVVNFRLKDKFDGVSMRAQYGITEEGDNPKYMAAITAGTSFGADDRGSFIGHFSYDKDEGLLSRKRAISAEDCFYDICGPGAYSSYSAQGRFELLDANGAAQDAYMGGSLFSFDTGNNAIAGSGVGFNRNSVRRISTPIERYLAAGIVNYELTDSIKAFGEVTYSKVKSSSRIEALALDADDIYDGAAQGFGIGIDNPFLPTSVAAAIAARNSDADATNDVSYIGFRRRQNEVFDRSNLNTRDTWRVAAGLKGTVAEDWNWEASYVYGRLHDFTESQDIDNNRYRNALDAVRLTDGSIVCRSASAQAEGCVPINIFGYGTASPEASAYVQAVVPKSEDIVNEQQVFSFGLSNSNLFALPAGDVGIAVGAEYRKEKSSDDLDILTNTGGNSGNMIPDTFGKFDVWEVYGEVNVPILRDTFVDYLGVTGAARYSDYSQPQVGGVFSWNAGVELQPFKGLRFRGVYAQANRAPNISEFASAPSETFASVNDPCHNVTAASTGTYDAACRAIPQVAAAIAADGRFDYTLADLQGINGFVGGNPNLKEETAKTLTVGAVITPVQVRGLSLTVDYFDIKVEDAINTVGRNLSIQQCLLTGLDDFCGNVIRNANTGFIDTVNDQLINVADLRTKGIDVGLRYTRPLGLFGDDRLDLSGNYSYLISFKTKSNPVAPVQDFSDTVYYPEHKASVRAAYLKDGFTLSWQANYLSGGTADIDLIDDEDAAPFNHVGGRFYHDAQVRYDIGENKAYSFYFGVDNVFDKKPPFLPGTPFSMSPTGTETAADVYDPFGRRFYAGVQVRF
ncbi:TonB-dependent receptor domain-containing protein [Sphingosinicella sp. LY1275]|uniref:TonB-dependent receptor domain-containing protein n=1 Tax=Sphingosinicella sp. LY1275 TaxID=3095379 RepID=UPI002ADEEA44|nr:TonB-dependent receptor [Sphingosinicella sp. LY1275]MEA1014557.1 TonB-dependent receptor [Sphingosinicella sp. LY1275]